MDRDSELVTGVTSVDDLEDYTLASTLKNKQFAKCVTVITSSDAFVCEATLICTAGMRMLLTIVY